MPYELGNYFFPLYGSRSFIWTGVIIYFYKVKLVFLEGKKGKVFFHMIALMKLEQYWIQGPGWPQNSIREGKKKELVTESPKKGFGKVQINQQNIDQWNHEVRKMKSSDDQLH